MNEPDGRTRFDYGYVNEYDYEIFISQIPFLQIRIRLRFGSTAFKDIFGQKQDII